MWTLHGLVSVTVQRIWTYEGKGVGITDIFTWYIQLHLAWSTYFSRQTPLILVWVDINRIWLYVLDRLETFPYRRQDLIYLLYSYLYYIHISYIYIYTKHFKLTNAWYIRKILSQNIFLFFLRLIWRKFRAVNSCLINQDSWMFFCEQLDICHCIVCLLLHSKKVSWFDFIFVSYSDSFDGISVKYIYINISCLIMTFLSDFFFYCPLSTRFTYAHPKIVN